MDEEANDEPDLDEILGWAEFCCWTALILAHSTSEKIDVLMARSVNRVGD